MRLDESRESENVEDRRGMGGGGGIMLRPGGIGVGGLLVLVVVSDFLGIDPTSLLTSDPSIDPGSPAARAPAGPPGSDPAAVFASKILADTEDTWKGIFGQARQQYPPPILVLYTESVESACGLSSAAMGPFYCPSDQKVYLDLSFFRELASRFGAPGDFAQAYVIAHEIGHHVQNLAGALSSGGGLSQRQANAQSVRQELQADCLAGVWGHSAATRGLLETGDVEEGLAAAAAVGDDRL